ncbi:MAG: hypothetical protein V3V13_10855 [Paracoccaceae bacterium]
MSDRGDIHSVLSAIRSMVRKETRARFSEPKPDVKKPDVKIHSNGQDKAPPVKNLPSKIFILQPYMRVDKPSPEILDDNAKIPYDTPMPTSESFAIADSTIVDGAIDPNMLRDMVREVVQEQLRGELGREIMLSVKKDMLKSLSKA